MFFESDGMNWEILDAKVSRQIMGYDDRIMLVKVRFEKGGIGALHQHEHSQTSYVAEGTFEVTIGEQKMILRKGDSFHVPSNEMHGVCCLEAGLLIDNFSPVRADFLE